MSRDLTGTYKLPENTQAVTGATLSSAKYNTINSDIEAALNAPWPASAGLDPSLTTTPTGAAGGDLAGTYPNPTVSWDNVAASEIPAGSVAVPATAPTIGSTTFLGSPAVTSTGIPVYWTGTAYAATTGGGASVMQLEQDGEVLAAHALNAFVALPTNIFNYLTPPTGEAFVTSSFTSPGVWTVGAGEEGVLTIGYTVTGSAGRILTAATWAGANAADEHKAWEADTNLAGAANGKMSRIVYTKRVVAGDTVGLQSFRIGGTGNVNRFGLSVNLLKL